MASVSLAQAIIERASQLTLLKSIICQLLCRGRLDSLALKQRTQLDWRRLLHGLTILIQQQLVFWYTSEDGYTTYEANLEAALALAKAGSDMTPIQERFGSLERRIVSELATLGYATVNDIIEAVRGTDRTQTGDGRRDKNEKHQTEHPGKIPANEKLVSEKVREAMIKLTQDGVLKVVNESHFRSLEDNRTEAERQQPPRGPLDKALKKSEQYDYDQRIAKTLQDWRQGNCELSQELKSFKAGDKRPHDGIQKKQISKKRKTSEAAQKIPDYGQETSEGISVRCVALNSGILRS